LFGKALVLKKIYFFIFFYRVDVKNKF
jgi:hypothetical protein